MPCAGTQEGFDQVNGRLSPTKVVRQKPIPTAERLPTAEDADSNGNVWAWESNEWFGFFFKSVAARPDIFTHWAPMVEPEKPEGIC